MVTQLIYTSVPRFAMTQHVLHTIADESRGWNEEKRITGVLMMANNVILQALEGPDEAVKDLYTRISADRRHMNCDILATRQSSDREFGHWPMAFYEVGSREADELFQFIGTLRTTQNAA